MVSSGTARRTPGSARGTGFLLHSPPARPLLGERSFGHDGAGGNLAFADAEHQVGFGYVVNQMRGMGDERANLLTAAVRVLPGRLTSLTTDGAPAAPHRASGRTSVLVTAARLPGHSAGRLRRPALGQQAKGARDCWNRSVRRPRGSPAGDAESSYSV